MTTPVHNLAEEKKVLMLNGIYSVTNAIQWVNFSQKVKPRLWKYNEVVIGIQSFTKKAAAFIITGNLLHCRSPFRKDEAYNKTDDVIRMLSLLPYGQYIQVEMRQCTSMQLNSLHNPPFKLMCQFKWRQSKIH